MEMRDGRWEMGDGRWEMGFCFLLFWGLGFLGCEDGMGWDGMGWAGARVVVPATG